MVLEKIDVPDLLAYAEMSVPLNDRFLTQDGSFYNSTWEITLTNHKIKGKPFQKYLSSVVINVRVVRIKGYCLLEVFHTLLQHRGLQMHASSFDQAVNFKLKTQHIIPMRLVCLRPRELCMLLPETETGKCMQTETWRTKNFPRAIKQ